MAYMGGDSQAPKKLKSNALLDERQGPVKSVLPYPPLHKNKKFVILSDWDGTITTRDSNDFITDVLGFGEEKRKQGNLNILLGKETFRDGFRQMMESISHTFDECKEAMIQNIKLDTGFSKFYRWTKANDVPFIVVSSGMAPFIRAVLSSALGDANAQEIEIISNDIIMHSNGKWEIQYRHPTSDFGHDKSQAILAYRNLPTPPLLFFLGDGVSDMSAARHADVLFVKKTQDTESHLATYCARERIPHILFEKFSQVLPVIEAIVSGNLSKEEALQHGGNLRLL